MLIILDLDGVIADYGASSREAAVRAAGAYLEEVCGITNGGLLVKRHHSDVFKRSGGFEDDKDLVYAIVYYLLTSLPHPLRPPSPQSRVPIRRARHVHKAFRNRDIRLDMLIGHSERDLEPVLGEINRRGGGVQGVQRYFGDGVMEKFILYKGEVGATEREAALGPHSSKEARAAAAELSEDLITRLYDEFYLGDAGFEALYGVHPMKPRGEGLLHQPLLLSPIELLQQLTEVASVALIANQPSQQLAQTLEDAGVASLFPLIIYESGLEHEPPPRPVSAQKKLIKNPTTPPSSPIRFNARMFKKAIEAAFGFYGKRSTRKTIYVTADPHRMELSVAAGVRTVAFTQQREERRRLKEIGVKAVISKLDTLLKVLET